MIRTGQLYRLGALLADRHSKYQLLLYLGKIFSISLPIAKRRTNSCRNVLKHSWVIPYEEHLHVHQGCARELVFSSVSTGRCFVHENLEM